MNDVGSRGRAHRPGGLFVGALAALALVGCNAQGGGGPISQDGGADTRTGGEDTGAAPQDVPVTPTDTGSPADTGTTFDTGTLVDTGFSVDTGTVRDTGFSVDTGTVRDTGFPVDTGTAPVDSGVTFPAGSCGEPVAPTSSGPVTNLSTIRVNWSMVCYARACQRLFVFVEDTETDMVALRFYDFLGMGGPAAGDTVDLSRYRAQAIPFFVSGLSGIQLEPTWRAERSYLAYEGTAAFTHLNRTSPLGSRLRVEFRNVRLRQIVNYTSGRCMDVPDGARMNITNLVIDATVNDWATDPDCADWAGPPPC